MLIECFKTMTMRVIRKFCYLHLQLNVANLSLFKTHVEIMVIRSCVLPCYFCLSVHSHLSATSGMHVYVIRLFLLVCLLLHFCLSFLACLFLIISLFLHVLSISSRRSVPSVCLFLIMFVFFFMACLLLHVCCISFSR
jgi:hypothetical protein